jgi:hypothetical protein
VFSPKKVTPAFLQLACPESVIASSRTSLMRALQSAPSIERAAPAGARRRCPTGQKIAARPFLT